MKISILVLAALFPMLGGTAKASECLVSDPTGTPLNVRATPGGRIVGQLLNGSWVRMIGTVDDRAGRRWAELQTNRFDRTVWVFREFVSCRN
ncbi:MAG: peptide-binding protein [Beijerinckiaceae bacterium]